MRETFVLIPGRTARQGTSLNKGKSDNEYLVETETLFLNADDMKRLGLSEGSKVRLSTSVGTADFCCRKGGKDEIPPGLLFLAYGPPVCALIGGDTHGTGMPDSKTFDVFLEPLGVAGHSD